MKTLLEDFDAASVAGAEVSQVCFGVYQLKLDCAPDVSILIRCELLLRVGADTNLIAPPYREASKILEALDKKILGVEIREDRFVMTLSGDVTVELVKNADGYESFEIWVGEKWFVV